jgi:oxygen-independent coproporphyrinogen-3 oxidase
LRHYQAVALRVLDLAQIRAGRICDEFAMHGRLLAAERNVPRYTSYPTAPHFTAAIGPDVYRSWLAVMPAKATLSLYLHVPYCTEICLYCGCNTKAARRRDPIDRYAEMLAKEIDLVAAATGRRQVVHLHWGGGTPSILGERHLRRLMRKLQSAFDLSTLREHAIELDPRRMSAALAHTFADIGVNRASLGVQDFSPRVQRAIGRVQPFDLVATAVADLRNAGIGRINIDLMYGLPLQTVEDVRHNTQLAAALAPQRIAIFGYAHVPWLKANQRRIDEATLPGLSVRITQAKTAFETLCGLGYVPIGLDHFALPSDELAAAARKHRLHRNFQGYSIDQADALIGLGASAIGQLPQGCVQNAVDTGSYLRAVENGLLATAKGLALSDDDRLRGRIIERLMCNLCVDLDAVAAADTDFSTELAELHPLAADGLVRIEGQRVTVTEEGRPFVRLVAATFDAYLAQARARHSIAV